MLRTLIEDNLSGSYAIRYRAYLLTEMTSYALISVQFRSSFLLQPMDSLMSAIVTGNIASAASYTFIMVKFRPDLKCSREF